MDQAIVVHDLGKRFRRYHKDRPFTLQEAVVFQSFNLIGDLTVYENVELPLTYSGLSPAGGREAASGALERVGMGHRMNHYPSQLSGGQQQRVAVARAQWAANRASSWPTSRPATSTPRPARRSSG